MSFDKERKFGGIAMEDVNFDSAVAAHEAVKRGEDPFKAVNKWVRKGGKKPAPIEEIRAPSKISGRDYFLAIARLARGNFEELSNVELVHIAAVVNVPVRKFAAFRDILDEASSE